MTKAEKIKIQRAIAAYTRIATESPAKAKAYLTKSGIYLADGTISPEYKDPKAA
jgi:hypothetical protein